jgi:hypothetical protein
MNSYRLRLYRDSRIIGVVLAHPNGLMWECGWVFELPNQGCLRLARNVMNIYERGIERALKGNRAPMQFKLPVGSPIVKEGR